VKYGEGERGDSTGAAIAASESIDSVDLDARFFWRDRALCAELVVRNQSNQEFVVLPSFVRRGANASGKYRLVSDPGSLGIDLTWSKASPVPEIFELNRVWPQYEESMVAQFVPVPARTSILIVTELGELKHSRDSRNDSQAVLITSIPLWRRGDVRLERLFSNGLAPRHGQYRVVADTAKAFQSYIVGSARSTPLTYDDYLLLQSENLGSRMKERRWFHLPHLQEWSHRPEYKRPRTTPPER
jgi:hypothetical protein